MVTSAVPAVGSRHHFSTQDTPAERRLPALRELFDRSVQLEINGGADQPVEMAMSLIPGMRRALMITPLTAQMSRPAPMLADGEDTVCLLIKHSGHLRLSQARREAQPADGDAVLLVYREPARLHFVDASYISVRVPFAALQLACPVGAAAATRIPRDTQALALLKSYVAQMPDPGSDPALLRLYVAHIYDLMALAIGATDEARERARLRGVRAARLQAIKAALVRDPGIELGHLAAAHGISPRYVQMLFEDEGSTFSAFVLQQKLDAAKAMLQSPRFQGWSITDIALEAGFGDLSYFNRSFKRRFQATPSEVRGQVDVPPLAHP